MAVQGLATRTKRNPGLRARLKYLYEGNNPAARLFRYAMLAFDVATIAFFFLTAVIEEGRWIIVVDAVIAAVIFVDLLIRVYIDDRPLRYVLTPATAADVLVIGSLLLPAFVDNLGFLRVLRALRLLRSYHLLRDLRKDSPFFCRNEDIIVRATNLLVFIFVVTSIVFVSQNDINPKIATYLDALYFTITTLTTTGFGDITLEGPSGRLLAVGIMVIGVSLFLRLLQAIFRPHKVPYECEDCGLLLHDPDAVHCKHCGNVLHIRTEGHV
ncbi:MAG TPA: ion channel [Microvirga sp.]|nr:ion channel [Microvirga sp.]